MFDIRFSKSIEDFYTDVEPNIKNKAVSFSAGVAIGRLLKLPEDKLQGSDEKFNNDLITQSRKWLSLVNELLLIDIQYAESVIKAVYGVRFKALYPESITPGEADDCIICEVFDIPNMFKDVCIKDLDTVKPLIYRTILEITSKLIEHYDEN